MDVCPETDFCTEIETEPSQAPMRNFQKFRCAAGGRVSDPISRSRSKPWLPPPEPIATALAAADRRKFRVLRDFADQGADDAAGNMSNGMVARNARPARRPRKMRRCPSFRPTLRGERWCCGRLARVRRILVSNSGFRGVDGGKNTYKTPARFAILNTLADTGIEMPYSQRGVHPEAVQGD